MCFQKVNSLYFSNIVLKECVLEAVLINLAMVWAVWEHPLLISHCCNSTVPTGRKTEKHCSRASTPGTRFLPSKQEAFVCS